MWESIGSVAEAPMKDTQQKSRVARPNGTWQQRFEMTFESFSICCNRKVKIRQQPQNLKRIMKSAWRKFEKLWQIGEFTMDMSCQWLAKILAQFDLKMIFCTLEWFLPPHTPLNVRRRINYSRVDRRFLKKTCNYIQKKSKVTSLLRNVVNFFSWNFNLASRKNCWCFFT